MVKIVLVDVMYVRQRNNMIVAYKSFIVLFLYVLYLAECKSKDLLVRWPLALLILHWHLTYVRALEKLSVVCGVCRAIKHRPPYFIVVSVVHLWVQTIIDSVQWVPVSVIFHIFKFLQSKGNRHKEQTSKQCCLVNFRQHVPEQTGQPLEWCGH